MFTGIIQHLGTIGDLQPNESGQVLCVEAGAWSEPVRAGDSIAVNGCCLTATGRDSGRVDAGVLQFDVIRQTLAVTALGELRAGDAVNLERAVTPTTLLSGHIVQGHIDGVGIVRRVHSSAAEWRVSIEPPPGLRASIVDKGSIAVEGVSLTVANLNAEGFEVALIPTTLRLTTLGRLREGQRVNLETDYLVKAVVHWLETRETSSKS